MLYLESPLPFFLDRLQNTLFLGTFDTFWGPFMQNIYFIFQAGAGYEAIH